MQVFVLGTGCRKCNKLTEATEQAIASSGIDVELKKIEDIDAILAYGAMAMPALVINDKVLSSGKIPKESEIVSWLEAANSPT